MARTLPFGGQTYVIGTKVHVHRFRDGRDYFGVINNVKFTKKSQQYLLIVRSTRGFVSFKEGEVLVTLARR